MESHPDSIEECAIGCSSCIYTTDEDGNEIINYCRICCETMLDWVW
jgi:hypothetical protein